MLIWPFGATTLNLRSTSLISLLQTTQTVFPLAVLDLERSSQSAHTRHSQSLLKYALKSLLTMPQHLHLAPTLVSSNLARFQVFVQISLSKSTDAIFDLKQNLDESLMSLTLSQLIISLNKLSRLFLESSLRTTSLKKSW